MSAAGTRLSEVAQNGESAVFCKFNDFLDAKLNYMLQRLIRWSIDQGLLASSCFCFSCAPQDSHLNRTAIACKCLRFRWKIMASPHLYLQCLSLTCVSVNIDVIMPPFEFSKLWNITCLRRDIVWTGRVMKPFLFGTWYAQWQQDRFNEWQRCGQLIQLFPVENAIIKRPCWPIWPLTPRWLVCVSFLLITNWMKKYGEINWQHFLECNVSCIHSPFWSTWVHKSFTNFTRARCRKASHLIEVNRRLLTFNV